MARPTLFTNRKFAKLARILGSRPLALGYLEFLWHAANESGNPVLGDAEDVEALAEWQGEAGELVAALMGCGSAGGPGFVVQNDADLYEIHDYWHHAPAYVRKRAAREEQRKVTSKPATSQGNCGGESVTSQRPVTDTHSPLPTPTPSPSPNKTNTARKRAKLEPPELAELKAVYPKRCGSQPWGKAVDAINARRAEGHTWREILDGAERYRRHCEADQSVGTKYVMQARTFCGPEKHFTNPWHPPPRKFLSPVDRLRQELKDDEERHERLVN